MNFLLDTTVLIDTLRARNKRRELLADFVRGGHRLLTSALNIGEVYGGMRPHEAKRTEEFLNGLDWLDITPAIAKRAGNLKSKFARRGRTLSLADMFVAATALEYRLTLVTDNQRDFPITELTLFRMQ